MDQFINLAKQGMQAYKSSDGDDDKRQSHGQGQGQGQFGGQNQQFGGQGGYGQQEQFGGQGGYGQQEQFGGQGGYGGQQQFGGQGGAEFNRPHGSGGSGGIGGFGLDQGAALGSAQAALGESGMKTNDTGLSSLFAQGLAMAQSYGVNKNPQDVDLDGDGVIEAHERAYKGNGGQQMDANSMGAAAAMQAMKQFTGGGGGMAQQSSGGNMQSKLIGMAMAEAIKLFNKNGGASNGSQQDVVSSASTTIMKLMLKSQMSGAMGTGGGAAGGGGGLGGLMSMASKFM